MSDQFEPVEKEIEVFLTRISEHYDSVRFFATARADDGEGSSFSYTVGRGNLHAQRGQIRAWLIQQDEIERENVRDKGESK